MGGLLAFSTCSLNPLENEAVVAALLARCGGALELLDASDRLTELPRAAGLHNWHVFDDNLQAKVENGSCVVCMRYISFIRCAAPRVA